MKQLRKLLWLTQLGISLVTPPLLCIFLAHLAQSKWGWGGWIMAVAIVSGLAVSFLHYCKRTAEKETKGEKPIAYNDHE
mgnify:CR=1 FL=1